MKREYGGVEPCRVYAVVRVPVKDGGPLKNSFVHMLVFQEIAESAERVVLEKDLTWDEADAMARALNLAEDVMSS